MKHSGNQDRDELPDGRQRAQDGAADSVGGASITPQLELQERHQPQALTSGIVPVNEVADNLVNLQMLVLSPFREVANILLPGRIRIAAAPISSMEEYRAAVETYLFAANSSSTRWLLLGLLADAQDTPLLGGTRVRESDLYSCIPRNRRHDLFYVEFFLLVFRIELLKSENASRYSSQALNDIWNRDSSHLSGLMVYRFNAVRDLWRDLPNHLCGLIRFVYDRTTQPSTHEFLIELQRRGLQQTRVNGLPRGLSVSFRRLVDLPVVTAAELPGGSPLENGNLLPRSLELHPKISVAVGVFVQDYSRSGLDLENRPGCEKDADNFTEIARMLGCTRNENNLYCTARTNNGYVVKSDIGSLITRIRSRSQQEDIAQLYLCISAHGTPKGFVLSDGRNEQLSQLVQELKNFAASVKVFYQSCRGTRRHYVDVHTLSTELEGFSFPIADSVGSSLPQNVPDCSAIFASCPGYASYSSAETGGLLLRALRDALQDFAPDDLNDPEKFIRLAERVQVEMRNITGNGVFKCQKTQVKSFVQIHFAMNSHS